jgi:predicted dehydrogenase
MKNNLYPKRYGGWDKKIKFISYRDVFESNNIYDLIIIGVPPKIHLTLLKQCFVYLNFKKILVEKPLCVFNQNFSFINQKKYKDKIYCGFNHSISKSFLFLINLILKKKIGKIKKIEINWKEDFKLILKAHPWIKNLKQSYLSNLRKGGGACHEYSHAVHLAVIFKKILFKNKIKIIKNIVYIKKNNSFYDSITQISFKDELRSIDLNIDAISNPCQKNIKIFGNNGTIIWERKIEKNYEKIEIRKGKNLNYKLFKLTRRDDFINQIKSLLFKKKKYNNSSNLKLESAVEVMNILKKIFKHV